MRFLPVCVLPFLLAGLLAAAPPTDPPTGVYRTAAQYRRQQPAPAAHDVRRSEKRSRLVVTQRRGPTRLKSTVPLDSVWGYVNGNGRAYRMFRGDEYQIQQADTLSIYSIQQVKQGLPSATMGRGYFFSRGLNGLIFPLTEKNLRLAFEASSPAFVRAVQNIGFSHGLSDYDAQAGSFKIVQLYRQTLKN